MRQKTDVLLLPVDLTQDEVRKYGELLAQEMPKQELLEKELSEFKKHISANVAKIASTIADLSNKINLKKELRSVECSIVYNFELKNKAWVRRDTGEIVKTEPLTEADCQEEINLETPSSERSES